MAAQNLSTPGGRVETGPLNLTLRVAGRVESTQGIGRIVVREGEGHAIRVEDVARVEDGEEDETTYAQLDQERTVVLSIRKQSGQNTVGVVDNVVKRLSEVGAPFPKGCDWSLFETTLRPSGLVSTRLKEHLVVGALLAALVVLAFLGNVRSTLIAALAIPISVIGTVPCGLRDSRSTS